MKLTACHIENFGKLSDFSMNFSSGINVINESNAWGKSTLAAFLKAMFYGFDSKKDAKAFEKERNLYRPWQGGTFGGQVDFEINGKSYRISRTFGRTEKTDTFHLYDLSTNLEVNTYSSDIGTEIFDLDSASFKRSIYIAQNDCSTGTSDAINAKLGNLAENTDDINNFESANKQLKEILNALTPDRVTGSLKKRKNYITQLTQELKTFHSAQEGLEEVKAKEQEISSEIEDLVRMRKNYTDALVIASEESRKEALRQQYQALCEDVDGKEQALQAFQEIFPIRVPEESEFAQQLQNIQEMTSLSALLKKSELSDEEKGQYDKFLEMFELKIPKDEELEETLAKMSEIDKQKEEIAAQEARLHIYEEELKEKQEPIKEETSSGYGIPISMGAGILLAGVMAILLDVFNVKVIARINPQYLLIGGIMAVVCGIIVICIGVVSRSKKSKEKEARLNAWKEKEDKLQQNVDTLSKEIQSMKDELQKLHDVISEFFETYKIECQPTEYKAQLYELKNQLQEYMRLTDRIEENEVLHEEYDGFRKEVLAFASELSLMSGEDVFAKLPDMQKKVTEYYMAETALQEAIAKKEAFENAQDKSFWTKESLCPYSIEELNEMIQQADEKLDSLKISKNQYRKQIEELQEQLDLRDEKSAELQEQLELQESEAEKYRLVKMTQEFLQKAKEQFTAKYMKPISEGFAKYYEILTMDEKENWIVDANITLKVKEQGELRDIGWLSAGCQDLIGICMRLALIEVMYKEEKPFLIFDDPFVNLDKQKVTRGNQLLVNVAREYQIIYFTCHDSRSPL